MSHLHLVPPIDINELVCRCDLPEGRYWFQGSWHCKAEHVTVRFYPTLGWHHYAGHQTISIPTELEQAA